MLIDNDVIATIAVRDMSRARDFYEGSLGLKFESVMDEDVVTYKAGNTRVFVYKSDFAGGYKATVATWTLNDGIERLVEDLSNRGVHFEHYKDMPDTELEGDIHVSGNMKAAWFKDPDGNILCVVQAPVH